MKPENLKKIIKFKAYNKADLLTIIVPVYNESSCIKTFHKRLKISLEHVLVKKTEIIYINDGSTDNSLQLLMDIANLNKNVQIIDFSRNFGKEAAMTAGINQTKGDAMIVIDSDLQDPPELIPKMVRQWLKGYDIVNMRRTSRDGETFFKKKSAQIFYNIIGKIGPSKIPENVGDFRLISRRAVDALKLMPENNRFMKGLFAWVGFSTIEIPYKRDARYAGKTKWNYWGLWNLAVEGITSYTLAPLKISAYLGLFTSFTSFLYAIFIMGKTLLYGDPVPGYPSLIVVILFLGGLQLLAIGIVGEYLGRIFLETKNRPLYLVKNHYKKRISTQISPANIIHKGKIS